MDLELEELEELSCGEGQEIHIGSYSLMYLKGFGGTLGLVEEDGDGDGGYGEGVGGGGGVGVFLC